MNKTKKVKTRSNIQMNRVTTILKLQSLSTQSLLCSFQFNSYIKKFLKINNVKFIRISFKNE